VQRRPKKKVEVGVSREFKEKTRFELATASRESAKMKQSVQRVVVNNRATYIITFIYVYVFFN